MRTEKKLNVVGWTCIVPQLAAFFAVLRRRPNGLTPFNLFVSGAPGTNKSEGMRQLVAFLGHSVALVDSSTLDDVSELAGMVDLRANREEGEARLIEGDLLKGEILILDEFLNTRQHVVPQFRLLLQGLLVLLGKKVEMSTRAIIGMGNLDEDMQAGQANLLDSPTADRFAMLVRVPSFGEMTSAEQEAILEGLPDQSFALSFIRAMKEIDTNWELTERELGKHATRYVIALETGLQGTPFLFQGRRGKLLRQFVLAGLALCRAESRRKLEEVIWQIVHDCLVFHKLSGVELDESALKAAHLAAFDIMKNTGVEALISQEPTLAGKITILLDHLDEVSAVTKADIFGQLISSTDVALQIAAQQMVSSSRFHGQPAELRVLVERIQLVSQGQSIQLTPAQLLAFSGMGKAEAIAFQLMKGDGNATAELMGKVNALLRQWQVI
jgi:hypothetical protein